MATYNKRGYKAPKEKEEKLDNNFIEDVIKLKKGVNNVDIKAAIYISGNDFFPEVLKYYDKK